MNNTDLTVDDTISIQNSIYKDIFINGDIVVTSYWNEATIRIFKLPNFK